MQVAALRALPEAARGGAAGVHVALTRAVVRVVARVTLLAPLQHTVAAPAAFLRYIVVKEVAQRKFIFEIHIQCTRFKEKVH